MSPSISRNIPLLRWVYSARGAETMVMPVIVLYWLGHGLSMAEVLFLQGFFSACVVLFEIPSGYFSDWFSRRTTLIASGVSTSLGLCVYLMASDFVSFLPAEIFFALGMSLFSGTLESMVYESHPPDTRAIEWPKALGSIQEWYFVMLAVYSIIGATIAASFDTFWTIAVAAVIVFSSAVFAGLLVEPERTRARDSGMLVHQHLRIIFRDILASRALLFGLAVFGVLLAINRLGFWYYQPLMIAWGLDVFWLGVVFSLFYLFAAFGNRLARFVSARFGDMAAIFSQIAFLGIGYVVMSRWATSYGWLGIALPRVAFGMSNYLQSAQINSLVSDDRRATVHSIASFVARMMYSVFLFGAGLLIADQSLSSVLATLGVATMIVGILAGIVVLIFRPFALRDTPSPTEREEMRV